MVVGLLRSPNSAGAQHVGSANHHSTQHAGSGLVSKSADSSAASRSAAGRVWLSGLLTEKDGLVLLAESDVLRRSVEVLAFWEG